jgi:hypothetical protein
MSGKTPHRRFHDVWQKRLNDVSLSQEIPRLTFRQSLFATLILTAAIAAAACGDDDPPTAPTPDPVLITETFPSEPPGRLTPNGGITHVFAVQQTGAITAVLTVLTPEGTTIGVGIGTWNGQSCSLGNGIARDTVSQGQSVIGNANATGNYCVRAYDSAGTLTGAVEYQLTVTHF